MLLMRSATGWPFRTVETPLPAPSSSARTFPAIPECRKLKSTKSTLRLSLAAYTAKLVASVVFPSPAMLDVTRHTLGNHCSSLRRSADATTDRMASEYDENGLFSRC